MPRKVEAVQEIRDKRREQIVKAAWQVFAKRGYAATKITDIAAAAGISHGLVTHYFTSKEELYSTIITSTLEGAERVTAEALQRSGSAWERLVWLCQEMLDGIRDMPEYGLVMGQIRGGENIPEPMRNSAAQYGESIQRNIANLIREGQHSGGVVQGDADQLAILLIALVDGLALLALDSTSNATLIPTNPDLVLRLLKA